VPLVPGGNQDIIARAVADEVAKGLGQQIIVENRPGQSAILGTQVVKAAAPDGYTLLSVSTTFARVPAIVKSAGYDAAADFTGVSLICRIPMVLVVNPGVAARSVQLHVAFPDVPTLGESGLPGFDDVTWNGYVAPAGTPRDVLARLHAEIARAVNNPEFRKRWLERGIETGASASPAEFSAYIKDEAESFVKLALGAGIKAE
jgi:tripartite-type tricarboxylate transporter receptor subunit TctC